MIINPIFFSGTKLPALDNPGTAADLLAGKQLIDQYGNPLTGTIQTKTASDLTASGATVTTPAGYYASDASKSVDTATQATPTISVSTAGLITASATQSAGYVPAGTKSATKQLTTQAAKTVTPTTSNQTAVSSGVYTTGAVTVQGDSNLLASNIKSGVSIFGVSGTYGYYVGSATYNSADTVTISVDNMNNYDNFLIIATQLVPTAAAKSTNLVYMIGTRSTATSFSVYYVELDALDIMYYRGPYTDLVSASSNGVTYNTSLYPLFNASYMYIFY